MERLKNSVLLYTLIPPKKLIVLEKRNDKNANPFTFVINLYLSQIMIFENDMEAIQYLCKTTCTNNRLSKNYLKDVEYFVHTINTSSKELTT